MSLEDLTVLERKTYEFIKEAAEVQPKNLPDPRMMGAVASLTAKGLVEVFRKYTTWSRKRKKKFVKVKALRQFFVDSSNFSSLQVLPTLLKLITEGVQPGASTGVDEEDRFIIREFTFPH